MSPFNFYVHLLPSRRTDVLYASISGLVRSHNPYIEVGLEYTATNEDAYRGAIGSRNNSIIRIFPIPDIPKHISETYSILLRINTIHKFLANTDNTLQCNTKELLLDRLQISKDEIIHIEHQRDLQLKRDPLRKHGNLGVALIILASLITCIVVPAIIGDMTLLPFFLLPLIIAIIGILIKRNSIKRIKSLK